jgi:hypothetical protein
MRIPRYTLVLGLIICAIGLLTAVVAEERELGRNIFVVGFFTGAFSAVSIILASSSLGKIAASLKIAAGGFGLIIVGHLARLAFDTGDGIASALYYIGLGVMLIGILFGGITITFRR